LTPVVGEGVGDGLGLGTGVGLPVAAETAEGTEPVVDPLAAVGVEAVGGEVAEVVVGEVGEVVEPSAQAAPVSAMSITIAVARAALRGTRRPRMGAK
jgi:hypothetical protein